MDAAEYKYLSNLHNYLVNETPQSGASGHHDIIIASLVLVFCKYVLYIYIMKKRESSVCPLYIRSISGEIHGALMALSLFPVVLLIMNWGLKYNPNTDMSIPIMQELRTDESKLHGRLLKQINDVTH
ncbi:hypothetical protein [Cohnella sp. REN36]|uniref:hypothetical protein n=1 Tax=Cohnella sp. REN36 TaxID=2887347 RepID=UPI001D13A4AE|nr:hypothetical protein [Cohnella sp. REN36]MCC3373732.1 hypothetical protein [Cohnella sp. REN36]